MTQVAARPELGTEIRQTELSDIEYHEMGDAYETGEAPAVALDGNRFFRVGVWGAGSEEADGPGTHHRNLERGICHPGILASMTGAESLSVFWGQPGELLPVAPGV